MIITLDTITNFALLVVSMLFIWSRCLPLVCKPPNCHNKPLTSTTYAKLCLAMLLLPQALLIALVVAGAGCPMLGNGYHGISLYHASLINIGYTLGKGWKARAYAPVIYSTLAALVSVIPVLCSLMSAPNICRVNGPPLITLSLCWTFLARSNIGTKICPHNNINNYLTHKVVGPLVDLLINISGWASADGAGLKHLSHLWPPSGQTRVSV